MSSEVALIVNPAAGRDIRRLVAQASVSSNREKVATTRRALRGMAAVGVKVVWALADDAGIVGAAAEGGSDGVEVRMLPVTVTGTAADSTAAARLAVEGGVGAIVTLGGDGTNRAVARGCEDVPLVPISTGTNNVFPSMVEGTVAGMAAGLVATGAVPLAEVCLRSKRIEVDVSGHEDIALIDAAVSRDRFVASRAIWDPHQVRALVLARAEPWAIGLSSIGGHLRPVGVDEPAGLYLEIGEGPPVRAPLAPGLIVEVPVRSWRVLELGEVVELPATGGTLALDGERELRLSNGGRVTVTANGPMMVDVRAALAVAARGADGG